MGNVFKQRAFECKCGAVIKEYVWENDLENTKVKCNQCSEVLSSKNLLSIGKVQVASIRTPTKNR
jgi:hypothetical protein